ncbi:MAG TPA: hypothetical protein VJV23_17055, partial [Candidatus Polarisedimenticolia bacterium]|nr:hypothetical protein [Candidatus Polarisedimenticolia bacterium]
ADWPDLRAALDAALPRHGLRPVPHGQVEAWMRDRRVRDASLATHEELADLAGSTGAELILSGDLYTCAAQAPFAAGFSGRLLDPSRPEILAMAMVALEGETLRGPLGSGPAITRERTLREAARRFAELLAPGPEGARRAGLRRFKASVLAPEPAGWTAASLRGRAPARIVVMPFRQQTRRAGAGQAMADAVTWRLVASGRVGVVSPAGPVRRLLERGWRTGLPVGADELRALRDLTGVDGVLMGTVERWEDGDPSGARPPVVALSARLLDTATGAILWAAWHERRGDQTRIVYEQGNERTAEGLALRAAAELLDPLIDSFNEVPRP